MIYPMNQTTLKQGVVLVKSYQITWCLLMIFVCSVQVYVGCKICLMC